jgi:hypothetical protein
MRQLTLYPRMGNLSSIEKIVEKSLPVVFQNFMKSNGGLSHYERIFIDKEETHWEVNVYLNYSDMYKLTEEFLQSYKRKLVPFAFDGGGWHFCLCMDEGNDYGKIIINRWTDHLPEEQFLVIADNFEEFINGLKTEENV